MSTNSRIRMVLESGEAKSIYCHWDGYPSNQMPILTEYYNTDEKVRELLKLGDISSLGAKVKPSKGETHSFDVPAIGVTVAYHRDRGEDLNTVGPTRQSYNYLWNGDKWIIE